MAGSVRIVIRTHPFQISQEPGRKSAPATDGRLTPCRKHHFDAVRRGGDAKSHCNGVPPGEVRGTVRAWWPETLAFPRAATQKDASEKRKRRSASVGRRFGVPCRLHCIWKTLGGIRRADLVSAGRRSAIPVAMSQSFDRCVRRPGAAWASGRSWDSWCTA